MSKGYEIVSVLPGARETKALQFGSGAKHLLLLPGLSIRSVLESAAAVALSYRGFTETYTVTLPDRRSALPEAYTLWDMAEDTAALMDALEMESADVMGVSQGGMIAQCLALTHPEKVRRLALCSTAASISPGADAVIARWRVLAERGDTDALTADFAEKLFSPAFVAKYGALLAEQNRTLSEAELARFCRLSHVGDGFDVRDRLSEIRCPALVLGAAQDAVLGEGAGEALAAGLPCCESYFYPAPYGHGVYDEAPDFKKRILEFLLQE